MTQENVSPVFDGFDISSMDTSIETSFNVAVITDIDGNAKSGFKVVGKNSEGYKQATHKMRVEGLMRASKRKAVIDTSTQEGADSMARTIELNDIALACSVVTGWFGFGNSGQEAEFNADIALKMLIKFPTWRGKVLEALENDANFIKG